MGYLKRRIRRSSARRAKLALLDVGRDISPSEWTECSADLISDKTGFLRFVIQTGPGSFVGLFRSSELLEGDESLPPSVRSQTRADFKWFDRHLAAPSRLPQSAVCWFRGDATPVIARIRTLIEAYRMCGHQVLMQGSTDPGRVVYRDAHQVAAIPHGRRPVPTAV